MINVLNGVAGAVEFDLLLAFVSRPVWLAFSFGGRSYRAVTIS